MRARGRDGVLSYRRQLDADPPQPRVPDEDMLRHYATICEGVDIPLMIHATAAMDVPFLQDLIARIPNVRYIKEETTYGPTLRRYVRELGDRVVVFGPGLHYPAELAWGAQGVMPSCCAPSHARVLCGGGERGRRGRRGTVCCPSSFGAGARRRPGGEEPNSTYARWACSHDLTPPAMGPPHPRGRRPQGSSACWRQWATPCDERRSGQNKGSSRQGGSSVGYFYS